MIQILCTLESFELLCKMTKKWGVFVSTSADFTDLSKTAPYLKDHILSVSYGYSNTFFILCDTKEEMESIYNQTIYDCSVNAVCASTCNPNGYDFDENT